MTQHSLAPGRRVRQTAPVGNESYSGQDQPTSSQQIIPEYQTILVERTIRSGQSLHYSGHIVVMGDVNPGAEIVAGGNIVVMGYLRGVAHAGATGNEKAIVAAFRLMPTQLRIAGHITRAPDGESWEPVYPEIARIKNGVVVIERYQSIGEKHLALYHT